MTLLELLVKELPGRGGWPEGADYVVQDCDGSFDIKFGSGYGYPRLDGRGVWMNDLRIDWGIDTDESYIRDVEILASDAPTIIITREQYEAAIAAQHPVWDGEGLPPVGVECEIRKISEWMKVTISFISEVHTVFKTPGGTEDCQKTCNLQFRPIRTEAERKREQVVDGLLSLGTSLRPATASIIYDAIAAGKIPGVELSK